VRDTTKAMLVAGLVVSVLGAIVWVRSNTAPPERSDPVRSSQGQSEPDADSRVIPAPETERVDTGDDAVDESTLSLAERSPAELAEILERSLSHGDDLALNVARNQLLVRAKAGDAASLDALARLLGDAKGPLSSYIARILGEVATTGSLNLLVESAKTAGSNENKQAILTAMATIGEWTEPHHSTESMASILQAYMETLSIDDMEALTAVSRGLATLGSPTGVERVLALIKRLPANDRSLTEHRQALADTLKEVRNPEAVPVLAKALVDGAANAETAEVAGDALAAMGQPEATAALIDWAAVSQSSTTADTVVRWLAAVRDPKSLELLLGVSIRQDFHNAALQARLLQLGKRLAANLS
jgi:hypothetical protein